VVAVISNPSKKEEFVQFGAHNWVVPLDNISYIPDWLSDALCRFVTGKGFQYENYIPTMMIKSTLSDDALLSMA
jgi:hypothetical protein